MCLFVYTMKLIVSQKDLLQKPLSNGFIKEVQTLILILLFELFFYRSNYMISFFSTRLNYHGSSIL